MPTIAVKTLQFTNEEAQIIFGSRDINLQYIEELTGVNLFAKGNILKIQGEKKAVEKTARLFEVIQRHTKNRDHLQESDILRIAGQIPEISPMAEQPPDADIRTDSKKKYISPQNPNQKKYIAAIRSYDLVMGIGPAGTGKTYLAAAIGIEMVKQGTFQKIILTRPAIEAGERLGFLPGDLEEKIKPYLQPIYDALYDILRYDELKKWMERRILEIVPLAYMRGRTLNNAFIILDEAQNTTFEQMKMFLTRLGVNSKAVITGDTTQIDLPLTAKTSGLVETEHVLRNITGIKFIYFTNRDVVRHALVKKIITAYEKRYKEKASGIQPEKRPENDKG